jgi:putative endonuclease
MAAGTLFWFKRLLAHLSVLAGIRGRLLADSGKFGRWGEKHCERFLKRKGMGVLARNFKCKWGEIDLIMSDGKSKIVFVEVKTRSYEKLSSAQAAVGKKKQTRLAKTARHFLKKYKIKDRALRFDVVAVILGQTGAAEVRHYENAFQGF